MSPPTGQTFPIGASIGIEDLRSAPYDVLAQLRVNEPVTWLPALDAWFITRRDLAVQAMRDTDTFTVADPRFTTAAVLGPSMLSLDGPEHERHRDAFAAAFRPARVRDVFEAQLVVQARELVGVFAAEGLAELRVALAGPMAVRTITRFLGFPDVEPADVLRWYRHVSDAIVGAAIGQPISPAGADAVADITRLVSSTLQAGTSPLLRTLMSDGSLTPEEIVSETAVIMFGAIETSEGMTANLLWHLLTHPSVLDTVRADPNLLGPALEESLRLEPAAAVVDRYTTTTVALGGVTIPERDMVTISLLGANRDPDVFERPDLFDIDRANLQQHVTFVQGPHRCIGLHLARLETSTAVGAVLDLLPDIEFDAAASSPPEGLIFRKPAAITARWASAPRR